MTPEERFWAKVDKSGDCWLWTAALNSQGYGHFGRGTRAEGVVRAHRYSYELLVGPVPEGCELDHLCRVRHCVNPAHLEPVTHRENNLRGRISNAEKTHCPRNHPYDSENTYLPPRGGRVCRACRREQYAERRSAA